MARIRASLRASWRRSIGREKTRTLYAKRWSIRTYLWLLALAVAVPCAGLLTYSIFSDARHDQDQVGTTTLTLAQLVGSQTKQFLGDAESLAAKLSQRPGIRALDPKRRIQCSISS